MDIDTSHVLANDKAGVEIVRSSVPQKGESHAYGATLAAVHSAASSLEGPLAKEIQKLESDLVNGKVSDQEVQKEINELIDQIKQLKNDPIIVNGAPISIETLQGLIALLEKQETNSPFSMDGKQISSLVEKIRDYVEQNIDPIEKKIKEDQEKIKEEEKYYPDLDIDSAIKELKDEVEALQKKYPGKDYSSMVNADHGNLFQDFIGGMQTFLARAQKDPDSITLDQVKKLMKEGQSVLTMAENDFNSQQYNKDFLSYEISIINGLNNALDVQNTVLTDKKDIKEKQDQIAKLEKKNIKGYEDRLKGAGSASALAEAKNQLARELLKLLKDDHHSSSTSASVSQNIPADHQYMADYQKAWDAIMGIVSSPTDDQDNAIFKAEAAVALLGSYASDDGKIKEQLAAIISKLGDLKGMSGKEMGEKIAKITESLSKASREILNHMGASSSDDVSYVYYIMKAMKEYEESLSQLESTHAKLANTVGQFSLDIMTEGNNKIEEETEKLKGLSGEALTAANGRLQTDRQYYQNLNSQMQGDLSTIQTSGVTQTEHNQSSGIQNTQAILQVIGFLSSLISK